MDINDPMVNRIGDVLVSEYDVENEFWRLVQSSHETVEIEYGADVHSTTHGRRDFPFQVVIRGYSSNLFL